MTRLVACILHANSLPGLIPAKKQSDAVRICLPVPAESLRSREEWRHDEKRYSTYPDVPPVQPGQTMF